MEAVGSGYVMWETRLVERFPCNSGGFSACCTLSLKDPEPPRKASNLSPKPSPKALVLVANDGNNGVITSRLGCLRWASIGSSG